MLLGPLTVKNKRGSSIETFWASLIFSALFMLFQLEQLSKVPLLNFQLGLGMKVQREWPTLYIKKNSDLFMCSSILHPGKTPFEFLQILEAFKKEKE